MNESQQVFEQTFTGWQSLVSRRALDKIFAAEDRFAGRPPNSKPKTITPRRTRLEIDQILGKIYNRIPCMTCGKPFNSEGKHNRLCGHCRHLSDD